MKTTVFLTESSKSIKDGITTVISKTIPIEIETPAYFIDCDGALLCYRERKGQVVIDRLNKMSNVPEYNFFQDHTGAHPYKQITASEASDKIYDFCNQTADLLDEVAEAVEAEEIKNEDPPERQPDPDESFELKREEAA